MVNGNEKLNVKNYKLCWKEKDYRCHYGGYFVHTLFGIVIYAPEHIYNEVGHSPRKLCR